MERSDPNRINRNRVCLDSDLAHEVELPELAWFDLLISQQKDFVQRLVRGTHHLLRCDVEGLFSELTVIPSSRTPVLRDFCWAMTDKYKLAPSEPKTVFINNLKGKLGEEALLAILGSRLTSVDYGVKIKGDDKIDFKLRSCAEIGIQVKARNGDPTQVKWSISREEIKVNKVIVCFLIQEEVNEAQAEFNIISAGFLPTDRIDTHVTSLSIEDLYYLGGLRRYLDFLEQQELFRQRLIASRLCSTLDRQRDEKLRVIWWTVLNHIHPPGTRALFTVQGVLLDLEGGYACVGIKSQPLFKMAQQRITNLEAAFSLVLGQPIKLSLEVTSVEVNSIL